MPLDPDHPDFAIRLYLHPDAAHLARSCTGHVDHPPGKLREDVMLLTSEVVTHAIRQSRAPAEETVELRVWMPRELVRVELRAHDARLLQTSEPEPLSETPYERYLLDGIADRWAIEAEVDPPRFWFEIDRVAQRTEAVETTMDRSPQAAASSGQLIG